MAQIAVYVDGFNVYYGRCRGRRGRKWLDFLSLARSLRPLDEIVKIRYFTARVSGTVADGTKPVRQQVYLRALRTIPILDVHEGYFRTDDEWFPLVAPDPEGPFEAHVWSTQEKGSDVNLATYLLLDGMDGLYQEALVISNDGDLGLPVQMAVERFGPVHVLAPNDKQNVTLEHAASSYERLYESKVRQSQFPETMSDANGTIRKPADW